MDVVSFADAIAAPTPPSRCKRVAAQDHQRDEPPDGLLAVGVGGDELRQSYDAS
jgi:hypothetical protein